MEFGEVIARRRSVRSFTGRGPGAAALDRVLATIREAPSAGNLQAYRVYVVRSSEARRRLAEAANGQSFLGKAPVDLVFFADPKLSSSGYGARGERLYCVQDATIAAIYAVLAAVNEGLGTAWVGAFDEDRVRSVCSESSLLPVAIVALGMPAEEPTPVRRRSREELFRFL